jgi:DNA-binding protein H-NS
VVTDNIYFQIIRLWVYIYALSTGKTEDIFIAEEPLSVCEWLDIELSRLTPDDMIHLIGEICDELTAQQLRQARELVDRKRHDKLDEARAQVMEEMREKFAQLDLDFDEVIGTRRGRHKVTLPPKYRNPQGQTWSGRGFPPQWIRDYEENGGDREEFLIKDEG